MKLYKYYIILLLITVLHDVSSAQQLITGTVLSATDRQPLQSASVKISGTNTGVTTNKDGKFSLQGSDGSTLVITYIGYITRIIKTGDNQRSGLEILMILDETSLEEAIVSTGYQQVPKERSNGSFAKVDNELINRRVSTDIISRLEDAVPGLVFNRKGGSTISIRGQSTLFSNAQPLVVVDNFPYDGDLNTINPNDVDNITILKDAAAASIWGSRAGNGVIVITTKKGRYSAPPRLAFNSNLTIGESPDLFYQPKMSTSDFIEMERNLFSKGYYTSSENAANRLALTPVVELLIAKRDGKIPAAEADAQIEALKAFDVRNDFDRYLYRNTFNQQHSISLSGGGEHQRYYFAGGFDKNLENLQRNSYGRINLSASNTYSLLNSKLEINSGIYLSQTKREINNPGTSGIVLNVGTAIYPYARLADVHGNSLSLIRDYRTTFLQQAAMSQPGLLDWSYSPLRELASADNTAGSLDYRVNTRISYKVTKALEAEVLYQYQGNSGEARNLQTAESYFTRDQINQFTAITSNGTLTRPLPEGSILDRESSKMSDQQLRSQISFNQPWNGIHSVNAIAGMEIRDVSRQSEGYRRYGYDEEHATSAVVDYVTPFTSFVNPLSSRPISNNSSQTDLTDRYLSYYTNAAYTYNNRYTISSSARFDQSNLFGVKSNQRGVPLWSAGLGYTISDEPFYKIKWLPYLKTRLTYGYNGNINKTLSAYTTATYSNSAYRTLLPFATIKNPPNPELRWEKVQVVNFGLDFESRGQVISGSLDVYSKHATDLIGETPFPPSSGITSFKGNTADVRGHGADLSLNTRNLNGVLKWHTNLVLGYAKDKVSDYLVTASPNSYMNFADGSVYPLKGKPLYSIYSYPYAGLNKLTGDPQGYVDGVASSDYAKIISGTNTENMIYNGPARPVLFGGLRNTLTWKQISLSANFNYRFGYYFRRNSVNYTSVLTARGGHGDYNLRWQRPGDEAHTSVPSMPASANASRDQIYLFSEDLVQKGDHIRLQDINLSYNLNRNFLRALPFENATFYLYANNIALLWKANDADLDPDYPMGPPARTIAAGLRFDF